MRWIANLWKHPFFGIIVLLLVTWAGLTIQMDTPWFGHHDGNGAWISAAVRNYDLYGLAVTKLVPVTDYSYVETVDNLNFYTHHPPLIVWLSALASEFIGLREITLRFVVASLTLISIAAFYTLSKRLLRHPRALLAAAFYALMPMTLYFGRMPNHEPLALAITMLFAVVMIDWLRQPTRRRFLALIALAVLAVWSMWGAVMLVGVLGLMGFIIGSRKQRLSIIGLGIVTVAAVAAFLLYYEWAVPGAFTRLLNAYLFRSSDTIGYGDVQPFTLTDFFRQQLVDLTANLTPGLLLLGLIGMGSVFRLKSRYAAALALALWGMAVFYILILRNAAFEHDFYKFFFVPAAAFTAAVAVYEGWHSRYSRFLRPALLSLVGVSLIAGFVYVGSLHIFARGEYQLTLRASLNTYREAYECMMINAPQVSLGMRYYVFRTIITDVTPSEAFTTCETPVALYAYCRSEAPEMLTPYRIGQDDYCAYFHINR